MHRDYMNRWSNSSVALAKLFRRSLFFFILSTYLLGAFLPGPGEALRNFDLSTDWDFWGWARGGVPARFSLWMVAILLTCGAASTDLSKLMEIVRRPIEMLIALSCVWLPPMLLVIFWSVLFRSLFPGELSSSATSLLLGMALIAAMPVANSAVGWTHQSNGSMVWAIGLVILSIAVCPWLAPQLLWLMGLSLSASDAVEAETLVAKFSGAIFVVWVILPTIIGFSIRKFFGAERIDRSSHWLTIITAMAILLLNYANASMALPLLTKGLAGRLLIATLVTAFSLPLAGILVGWFVARAVKLPSAARTSWGYALGMKNTGLALSLADTALGNQPIAVLFILTITLTQHAVISLAHYLQRRKEHRTETDLLEDLHDPLV